LLLERGRAPQAEGVFDRKAGARFVAEKVLIRLLTAGLDLLSLDCSCWLQARTWRSEMPYFVRKPYAEAEAPQRRQARDEQRDVLALAQEVLTSAVRAEPRLRIRDPLRPGEKGEMVLELTAEKGAAPLRVSVSASELVGDRSRISSDSIHVVPSTLTVPAGASADVKVTVLAPLGAAPGLYAGTLSVTGDDNFSAPFEAEVR
jgi:hypothetical protein